MPIGLLLDWNYLIIFLPINSCWWSPIYPLILPKQHMPKLIILILQILISSSSLFYCNYLWYATTFKKSSRLTAPLPVVSISFIIFINSSSEGLEPISFYFISLNYLLKLFLILLFLSFMNHFYQMLQKLLDIFIFLFSLNHLLILL